MLTSRCANSNNTQGGMNYFYRAANIRGSQKGPTRPSLFKNRLSGGDRGGRISQVSKLASEMVVVQQSRFMEQLIRIILVANVK